MPRNVLTGTRIRERRMMMGVRQADLAHAVGISPSYLNLIEHNRRRIGGKLLNEIARRLEVDAAALTEGAGAAMLDRLRVAAVGHDSAEQDRIEEFAGRFPGWAQLLADTQRHIRRLERTVEMLTDRMTHDPFLSASVHEVLSTVTAIRSTAAILIETEDIDPEWRRRFHRNIGDESTRLAESAQALVNYLDNSGGDDLLRNSPQEEVEVWLKAQSYHLAVLEGPDPPSPETVIAQAGALDSASARDLALAYLRRYRADALKLPLEPFCEALEVLGPDPGALADRFAVSATAVFRRLASLPPERAPGPVGLAICDGSGTLTFRKPVEGFNPPRFGAACPLWPLYQALSRPTMPVRGVIELAGRLSARFLTYALCLPRRVGGFGGPQVFEASMLILPAPPGEQGQPVGASCRICPREDCVARREPSIIAHGF
ncbi:hypothetical protein C8N32_11751 [Rhodovulum imhoffii]|uniref:HTH cro/C1-type domain-containing protein n=1 Tax=Rhodovulum imhoffii TaxID=365340 RepID=A0A2T5BPW0_9RHOB|nr:helix-turn-helix transcriptional regulator [Rhodovulum imhoffii]MBK5933036.1 transcriptional regulator [Rhodovulum imhoffii]PTN01103.1 hypothetical protein C8N32_11751 [Rhodovulum imhoffii]